MQSEELLLGIDVGSTSVKCAAMTPNGQFRALASSSYRISSPHPGWVEQDPNDWWRAVVKAIRTCLKVTDPRNIRAVSFSGHMSALVLLDDRGEPVRPSILVADTRSSKQTRFLREHYREAFVSLTGNEPLEAFVAPRLLWLKEHEPEVLAQAKIMVFPKDYIRYRMTGHLGTDPTDAGNTLLFNPRRMGWEWNFIQDIGLDTKLFPPIFRTAEIIGAISPEAARKTGLPEGIPVVTGGADIACSQLGSGAVAAGTMSVTLSTSAQIVVPLKEPLRELVGSVTFHPAAIEGTFYAMGTVFTGGLGVDWGYKLLSGNSKMKPSDFDRLTEWTAAMEHIPPGSKGLLFLPFLVGSGSPYFDARDKASWLGLSLGQDKLLMLNSILEGITYNIRENIELFAKAGVDVHSLNVGGGGSQNPVWCRIVGDVTGKEVSMLRNRDASVAGAAMLAGIGVKCYSTIEEAVQRAVGIREKLSFSTDNHDTYNRIYNSYREVYQSLNRYYRSIEQ
jgi:xylulokinase